MPRRHRTNPGDWGSLIRRLDELVRAGSGADPFDEIHRLITARILDEQRHGGARLSGSTLDALLAEADAVWPGLSVGPSQLPAGVRAAAAELLAGFTLLASGLEAVDSLFEGLSSRTSRGERGQFFTPRHVVQAAIRIAQPRPGQRVLDPACGSGAFLLAARRQCPDAEIRGQDFDPRAVRVARTLVAASGGDPAWITRGDSLRSPPESADLILTNPPFAGEIQDADLLADFEVAGLFRRVERDVLFVEQCVRLLKPGGRLVAVLPHNKVGALAFAPLRRWLMQRVKLVGVVGLPRETFLPHTSQKTAILVGVKRPAPVTVIPAEPIRMVVCESVGKDSRGAPVFAEGADRQGPAWSALAHDLDEVVAAMDGVWA
ncbi:MAG: type I restriction enzyme M protein [Myxococcota bacterium]|jgi:type I restriction enzyme M protein